jgi:hypothetical protein
MYTIPEIIGIELFSAAVLKNLGLVFKFSNKEASFIIEASKEGSNL